MPGGAGYGDVADRDPTLVKKDLVRGYISAAVAKQDYGMSEAEVKDTMLAIKAE
jgi:N-methylhydantoinase B